MKAARESWGFSGYVTSDSDSIADAYKAHKYVPTAAEASCAGVAKGQCDIDSGNTYFDSLLEGVKAGHCSQADVDRAVANTLKTRFELGLFDPKATQKFLNSGIELIPCSRRRPAGKMCDGWAAPLLIYRSIVRSL